MFANFTIKVWVVIYSTDGVPLSASLHPSEQEAHAEIVNLITQSDEWAVWAEQDSNLANLSDLDKIEYWKENTMGHDDFNIQLETLPLCKFSMERSQE